MSPYPAPDVYIEAVPQSRPRIVGADASTAGFAGLARDVRMPARPGAFRRSAGGDLLLDRAGNPIPILYDLAEAGVPTRIASWDAFRARFGDVQPGNGDLANAVYGFFNNGGTACWVLRIDGDALPGDLAPALEAFEAIDEIAIVAVPGATAAAQHDAIIAHCAKLQDRVAILDGARADDGAPAAAGDREPDRDRSYAALYRPWIKIIDPVSGRPEAFPPSGHIAGVFARSDARSGVFKAPANEALVGAVGLAEPLGPGAERAPGGAIANVLRPVNGEVRVWGARTLAAPSATSFPYISNRRYFNFLREAIEEGTQFVVFEPNAPALWQRIRRAANAFLLDQWQLGALFGDTPDEAFFVKCDGETNPPEIRALGKVVTEIGVAMVRPAEFVILRLRQETGG